MQEGYNSTERLIAKLLSNTPVLKRFLKKTYQTINYIIYHRPYKYKSDFEIVQLGDDTESFFGYYDKSPVNQNGKYMIYHKSSYPSNKKPVADQPISVVLYDLMQHKEICLFPSSAWNWQQGTKLQWISASRFIFNDYDKERDIYISKIVNAENGEIEKVIDFPVYEAGEDFAISLNFSLLNLMRPDYGYRNMKSYHEHKQSEDGICWIDFKSNSSKLLLSLDDCIHLHARQNMNNARHWINHIMLAPDQKHFIFLHRWNKDGRKYDALILSDLAGKELRCLADDDMVSHCCWINNTEIIAYMRAKNSGDKYYRINIVTGSREILGKGIIDNYGDGHPGVYDQMLLFDTYPNKARMKELFVFDMNTAKIVKLAEFFESLCYYGETRCDLHPRWSPDGKEVFFDSVHSGKRHLYKLIIGDQK